ncbi:polysaccharide biosynthesis/export family protein [Ideonella sp. 4Y11]|uniref:Polysaccharide biosynthesis/export family protein n=1 Tax=Ideonella aquatica TaxID=2824119 RepID=A0A940YN48_9BURK|nr:polysaccharide biosynthesis/export family protein [Ideonella aquatica]MBQ0959947.1 polysaccharide biosynthesis/export family protein [Ideonella aquatica]
MKKRLHSALSLLLASLVLLSLPLAQAQAPVAASAPAPAPGGAPPMTAAPAVAAPAPVTPATAATVPLAPLPIDPALSLKPVVFGSQMFTGRFAQQTFSGFNPDYQIAVGDRLMIRMWGAQVYEAYQTVDPQGNIFVPNVGPVAVLGVRNTDLNRQVEEAVKRVFRANVGIYATLDSAQPVKLFVTGFVRAPGLYAGLSSDSVLAYLDRAGGIDPERGSYLNVQVMRAGRARATIDLYRFLLDGVIERPQLQDGDTIVVQPRRHTVTVTGEAQNPYLFEIRQPSIPAADLLRYAVPKPSATHLSVVRNTGVELKSEYHAIGKADQVMVQSGDLVTLTADKYPTTLLVRVDGAQRGERSIVLPNGATLKDLIARLNPSPQANMAGLQLYRKSVQARQKQTLDVALRNLETSALTARSTTAEEAALRKTEADLMIAFVERARAVQPLGQVVLADRESADSLLLEDGDVVNVPESKNLVLVSGEVLFPNALVYSQKAAVNDYVELAGGYTQKADTSKVLVLRANGSVAPQGSTPGPGDEIMVLPKIDSKNVEVTRGITQIIYQIAIAAKVALGL